MLSSNYNYAAGFDWGVKFHCGLWVPWAALCVESNVNPHLLIWSTTYTHLVLYNIHASKPVNYLINLLNRNAALLIAIHYQLLYLVFDWYDNSHEQVTIRLIKFLADWVGYAVCLLCKHWICLIARAIFYNDPPPIPVTQPDPLKSTFLFSFPHLHAATTNRTTKHLSPGINYPYKSEN